MNYDDDVNYVDDYDNGDVNIDAEDDYVKFVGGHNS